MTDPTVAADGKAHQLTLLPVCLLPALCQHAWWLIMSWHAAGFTYERSAIMQVRLQHLHPADMHHYHHVLAHSRPFAVHVARARRVIYLGPVSMLYNVLLWPQCILGAS